MNDKSHENQGKDEVTIYFSDPAVAKQIHRGSREVAEIKTVGSIPLADDLEQLLNGKLELLDDNGRVTIKGGEHFYGHPKDSGSSAR
jgi:hypothetical protein